MTLAEIAREVQDRYAHLDAFEPLSFWLLDRGYSGLSRWRILNAAYRDRSLDRVAADGTLDREDVDAADRVLRGCLLPAGEQPYDWSSILETTDAQDFPAFRRVVGEVIDADELDDFDVDDMLDEIDIPFLVSA